MKENFNHSNKTDSPKDLKPTETGPEYVITSDDNSDKKPDLQNDGRYKTDDKKPQLSNIDKAIAFLAIALLFMAILPILGPAMGFPIPNFIPTIPLEVGYGLGIPMAGYSGYKFVKNLNDQAKYNRVALDNPLQSQQHQGVSTGIGQAIDQAQVVGNGSDKKSDSVGLGSSDINSTKEQAHKIAEGIASKESNSIKEDPQASPPQRASFLKGGSRG